MRYPRRPALVSLSELPKREISAVILLVCCAVAARLAGPHIIARIIDDLQIGQLNSMLLYGLSYFLACFGLNIIRSILQYTSSRLGWSIALILQQKLLRSYLNHRGIVRESPGAFVDKIDGDVQAVAATLYDFINDGVINGLMICCIIVLVAQQHLLLGLSIGAGALTIILFQLWSLRLNATPWQQVKDAVTHVMHGVASYLQARFEIHQFNGRTLMQKHIATLVTDAQRFEIKALMINATFWTLGLLMILALMALGLISCVQLYMQGSLTIGALFILYSYLDLIREPLENAGELLKKCTKGAASFRRISLQLAAASASQQQHFKKHSFGPGPHRISFVKIKARQEHLPTTFIVEPGTNLRIEGNPFLINDFFNLLKGLQRPLEGMVFIEDAELDTISQPKLYKLIGFWESEAPLLRATLRENIRLFDQEITDGEILQALRFLGINEIAHRPSHLLDLFLEPQLTQPIDAHSIMAARLYLQNPTILVINEPTAQLDPKAEKTIAQIIKKLIPRKTTLIYSKSSLLVELAKNKIALELSSPSINAQIGNNHEETICH